jgi:hypothetical protein
MMYFGDVAETNRLVDILLPSFLRYAHNPACVASGGGSTLICASLTIWPMFLRLLGRTDDATAIFNEMTVGQACVDLNYQAFVKPLGSHLSPLGAPPLCGKGIVSREGLSETVAACRIMLSDELDSDGQETLTMLAALGGRGVGSCDPHQQRPFVWHLVQCCVGDACSVGV